MELHERIRLLRKELLSMTQADFGEKLGVSRDVIKNIENNRLAKPEQKLSLLKLICREFNVNEEWLRDGSGDVFIKLDRDSEIEKRLTEILADSSDSFRKRFIDMMIKLSDEEWLWIEAKARSLITERYSQEVFSSPDPVSEAEAAYIKSRSDFAHNTDSSASNTG